MEGHLLTIRLPKKIEADPRHDEIKKMLSEDLRPLWEKGTILVPHVPFFRELEKTLGYALRDKHLARGLENIGNLLNAERKGLAAVHERQGTTQVARVSRLLIIPDKCTERFYRTSEAILFNHSDRLLCLRVDVSYERLAQNLFGEDALVKALLVSDRDATSDALLALLK